MGVTALLLGQNFTVNGGSLARLLGALVRVMKAHSLPIRSILPLNLTFTEIAKRVGEQWQQLAPDIKAQFESQASIAKERYRADLEELLIRSILLMKRYV